ncbi:hypothetical protein K0M31_005614 [Melipona bicolor]|uniref:Uncharacterized protein n=1 Tax=Melipona bicolor TaxID=60889 RepID=A0AA40FU26_9HYME|nr:hypothetical protein K0M31_005614 [Melipona bicolor]
MDFGPGRSRPMECDTWPPRAAFFNRETGPLPPFLRERRAPNTRRPILREPRRFFSPKGDSLAVDCSVADSIPGGILGEKSEWPTGSNDSNQLSRPPNLIRIANSIVLELLQYRLITILELPTRREIPEIHHLLLQTLVETKELGRSTAYYPARSTFPPCNDPSFCSNCCNIVPPCSHPDTDNACTGGNPIRLPINIYLDGRGKRRDRDTPCEPPIKNSTGPESLHRLINIPAFIVSASRCGPLRDFLVNRQAGWCRPRKPGQDVGAEGADADAGFNLRYPKDNGGLSLALSAVT